MFLLFFHKYTKAYVWGNVVTMETWQHHSTFCCYSGTQCQPGCLEASGGRWLSWRGHGWSADLLETDLLLRCMSCDVQPRLRTGLAVCLLAYVSQFFVSPNGSLILDKTAANHREIYSNINCNFSCDNSGDKKTLSKNIWIYINIFFLHQWECLHCCFIFI